MTGTSPVLRAAGRVLPLERPLLMGIVNATPDSFSDAGELPGTADRIARGRALLAAGADILDVGGESARGDRPAVPAEEEIARVVPVIAGLAAEGAVISVDTHKPAVAEAAVRADSPPTSRMSAPAASSARPRAIRAAVPGSSPASEKESGVALTMPISSGRSSGSTRPAARRTGVPPVTGSAGPCS